MKSVLMSFSPYWYYLIGEGIKTEEVRKAIMADYGWDSVIKCYMTKDKKSFNRIPKEFQEKYRMHIGKVGMQFVCDRIEEYSCEFWDDTPDYMSKDHPMERIQKLYFQDDEDLDWKDYLYIIGNEVENPDDCELCRQTCLKYNEIRNYIGMGDKTFFTLHISDLKIYDKQKELKEFYLSNFKGKCEYQERGYNLDFCTAFENGMRFCKQLHCDKKRVKTAPQSWLYVEG